MPRTATPPRPMYRRVAGFAVVFGMMFLVVFFATRRRLQEQEEPYSRTQIALGTVVEITVRGRDRGAADAAMNAAFAEVRRVDTLFSTYVSAGPIARMNATPDTAMDLDPEIATLFRRCDTLTTWTDGAFDAAVHPLIDVWGFERDTITVPQSAELERALGLSGWGRVRLEGNRLHRFPGTRFNLGAVAKGYAVDRAIAVLERHGISDALVNAGGEIRELGGPWSVGIQHPRDPHTIIETIVLHGRAVATSGDYEQFVDIAGVRYHHILDPATGQPARGCRSVTVIARDDTDADALATGVFVLGPERGLALIERLPGVEAMIIDSTGARHESSGFTKHIWRD